MSTDCLRSIPARRDPSRPNSEISLRTAVPDQKQVHQDKDKVKGHEPLHQAPPLDRLSDSLEKIVQRKNNSNGQLQRSRSRRNDPTKTKNGSKSFCDQRLDFVCANEGVKTKPKTKQEEGESFKNNGAEIQQKLDTTSQVFKRIQCTSTVATPIKNNNKPNARARVLSKNPADTPRALNDMNMNIGRDEELSCDSEIFRKQQVNLLGHPDQLHSHSLRPHRSVQFSSDLQQKNRGFGIWRKLDPRRPKKRPHQGQGHGERHLLVKKREQSQKLSMFPSDCSGYLEPKEKRYLRLRQLVSREVMTQTNRMRAEEQFDRPAKTWDSDLAITKRFECFPTRAGDHDQCFFNVFNRSELLMAYHIRVSHPENYSVLPSCPYIVPPGKNVSIHLKTFHNFNATDFDLLKEEYLIIESTFIPPHTQSSSPEKSSLHDYFQNFTNEQGDFSSTGDESSICTLPMSLFFVHPCSIVPIKASSYHGIPIHRSLAPPPIFQKYRRQKLLQSRSHGEKVFEQMEANLAALLPQLEKLRKQTYFLSLFLQIICYGIFLGLLIFAGVYLSSVNVQLTQAAQHLKLLTSPYISSVPDYSHHYTPVRWLLEGRDFMVEFGQEASTSLGKVLAKTMTVATTMSPLWPSAQVPGLQHQMDHLFQVASDYFSTFSL